MRPLLSLAFIFLTLSGFGQDLHAIEMDLLQKFSQIQRWSAYRGGIDTSSYDSLEQANEKFEKALFHYASTNPNTIHAAFTQLKDSGLIIATSNDGRFRIYSWDTEQGGTMHFFSNIYQYKDAQGVYAHADPPREEGDPGYFCSDIYTLPAIGKKYYLAINQAIFSTKDCRQSIQVFAIAHHALDDSVRIIKTPNGLVSSIDVDYNFISVVEDHLERPVHLIDYDPVKKIIRIPVVKDNGTVTKGTLHYQFTGRHFQYIRQSH